MRKTLMAVAATFFAVASSRLVVYGPQELKDKFEYTCKTFLNNLY
jgi:hypothetical protein